MLFLLQIDPANFEGLKSRLEQKDKEICALKQAAKVRICLFVYKVLGKVWPGFKNKYDLDIYDLR